MNYFHRSSKWQIDSCCQIAVQKSYFVKLVILNQMDVSGDGKV